MKTGYLKAEDVLNYLEAIPRESIFSVTFEKKDASMRRMVCRRDVRSKLKGGESTIREHVELISVFDTEADSYRCFDATKVKRIKGGGLPELIVAGYSEIVSIKNARGEEIN